jgi:CheY-like chemotaxis protein
MAGRWPGWLNRKLGALADGIVLIVQDNCVLLLVAPKLVFGPPFARTFAKWLICDNVTACAIRIMTDGDGDSWGEEEVAIGRWRRRMRESPAGSVNVSRHMREREVLICDARPDSAESLASQFRRQGWAVHKTCDEAEAAYRLLVWHDRTELPELVVLDLHEAADLLEFCAALKEEGILALVSVIVLLDAAASHALDELEQLGAVPLKKSGDLWPQINAVMNRLRGLPSDDDQPGSETRRPDPCQSALRSHSGQITPAKARRSASSASTPSGAPSPRRCT